MEDEGVVAGVCDEEDGEGLIQKSLKSFIQLLKKAGLTKVIDVRRNSIRQRCFGPQIISELYNIYLSGYK